MVISILDYYYLGACLVPTQPIQANSCVVVHWLSQSPSHNHGRTTIITTFIKKEKKKNLKIGSNVILF